MRGTEGVAEDESTRSPVGSGVVAMEPGSAENDGVTASVGDVEDEVFFMMAHPERSMDFSVDAAHRMTVDSNGGARVFLGNGEEVVVLDEGGAYEVRGGTGVDHDSGEGCDFATP